MPFIHIGLSYKAHNLDNDAYPEAEVNTNRVTTCTWLSMDLRSRDRSRKMRHRHHFTLLSKTSWKCALCCAERALQLGSLRLQQTWLTSLAQKHTHTERRHLPIARLLAHSALLRDTSHFACAESHMQTGVICPSLALLAHSALSADPLRAPPGGMVAMAYPDHPLKFQPNWPTDSWDIALFSLQECHLVGDWGATWWQCSHDPPWPSTKVSAKSAHRQLSNRLLHRDRQTDRQTLPLYI